MQTDERIVRFRVNGRPRALKVGQGLSEVDPSHTLAHTLRETLGLTGTKVGCDQGSCGACTVLMDGEPVLSCMTLTIECGGREITTIEGLAGAADETLHPVQESFMDHSAFQCGFCTPGIIMSATALLDENPAPQREQVTEALSGHYCRCISHYQAVEAVLDAAARKGGR